MPLPRPPSADPLVALADQCVQCGLCLPACPTYRRDRIEAESPRGRIALGRAWALQALEPTATGDDHLDHCLACRSCEAACPAGVRYGALLLGVRERQRRRRPAGARQRLVEMLAARPRVLAAVLRLHAACFRLLPARLRRWSVPPAMRQRHTAPDTPPIATHDAPGNTDMPRAALFVGCAALAYEPATRAALRRLLAACGVGLDLPYAQTCCGTLHAHGGDAKTATRLVAANAAAFADAPLVLTLASGCHEAVAAALPASTTMDALEFLAARADRLRFRPATARVALHLPCTQRNVVRSVPALRRLLGRVPSLQVVELDAGAGCCGAAGTAMLTDPGRAASFRAPLVAQIDEAGVDEVLSANIGCRLHLGGGTSRPVRHPVDFLAAHLDGAVPDAQ